MQIGTRLLDEIVKYAFKTGVKRISWEVLDWNQPAIEFYNKKGAKIKEDWRVVHLDEKGIKNPKSLICGRRAFASAQLVYMRSAFSNKVLYIIWYRLSR